MPALTRWYIKSALAYLVAALLQWFAAVFFALLACGRTLSREGA